MKLLNVIVLVLLGVASYQVFTDGVDTPIVSSALGAAFGLISARLLVDD